jgi:hypothetical protein
MSKEINKYIDVEGRKFCISKYPAKDGLKTARLIIAKILPVLENFISPAAVAGLKEKNDGGELTQNDIFEYLNIDNITKALEMISDEDLDLIIKRALMNCYEALPAGNARILNENGTYGVDGVEYDYILTLRLVAESLVWSIGSFFDVSRLTSVMTGITGLGSLLQNA